MELKCHGISLSGLQFVKFSLSPCEMAQFNNYGSYKSNQITTIMDNKKPK